MRLFQPVGRFEIAAIGRQRIVEVIGREMRGEGIGQAERSGELGAEQARSQHPHLNIRAKARMGAQGDILLPTEIGRQLHHVLRKLARRLRQVLAEGGLHPPVGPGRTTQAEIDPTGEQRVERAELLGDHEGIVIGQHDPARPDPDGRSRMADMREHDRGCRAADPFHRMMLGDPEALVAVGFRRLCEAGSGLIGFGQAPAFADGDEIEHGKVYHASKMGRGLAFSMRKPNWWSCRARKPVPPTIREDRSASTRSARPIPSPARSPTSKPASPRSAKR